MAEDRLIAHYVAELLAGPEPIKTPDGALELRKCAARIFAHYADEDRQQILHLTTT